METLKVAVIGTGNMGKNHIRTYSQMPNVELVGVSDVNIEMANKYGKEYNCNSYKFYEQMIKEEKPQHHLLGSILEITILKFLK